MSYPARVCDLFCPNYLECYFSVTPPLVYIIVSRLNSGGKKQPEADGSYLHLFSFCLEYSNNALPLFWDRFFLVCLISSSLLLQREMK